MRTAKVFAVSAAMTVISAPVSSAQTVPSASESSCPTAADMRSTGVYITTDDQTVTHYFLTPLNTIWEASYPADGSDVFWILSYNGIYPVADGFLKGVAPTPDGLTSYEYPTTLDALPAPGPNASWSGIVKTLTSGANSASQTVNTLKMDAESALEIGGCPYTAIRYKTFSMSANGSGNMNDFQYLPELGLAIIVGYGPVGQPVEGTYRPIAISTTRTGN